jgi:hypothetical protein
VVDLQFTAQLDWESDGWGRRGNGFVVTVAVSGYTIAEIPVERVQHEGADEQAERVAAEWLRTRLSEPPVFT